MKSKISITMNQKTIRQVKALIDGVRIGGLSQAIEYLVEKALEDQKTAVILASHPRKKGLLNKADLRPILRMGNSTVIELAVKKLAESNFRNIYIVGGHELLSEIYKITGDGSTFGVRLTYIEEYSPGGSAISLKALRGKITSSFIVVLDDIVFTQANLQEFWKHHLQFGGIATVLLSPSQPMFPHNEIGFKLRGNKIIELEKKATRGTSFYFMGLFAAEPELLDVPGRDLSYDIFQRLSEKGLLKGYVESVNFFHVHDAKEARKLKKKYSGE